jgi:predicted O-methyltransferase YrrM
MSRVRIEDIEIGTPAYTDGAPRCAATCSPAPAEGMEWYPPVMVGADSLYADLVGNSAVHVRAALALLERLEADAYSDYITDFYRRGLERYGEAWRYADLVTAVMVTGRWLKPQSYLEIGVRRGRSVCAMAQVAPDCDFAMFDMWMQDYAGMPNPGQALVVSELDRIGHRGRREFIDGDSHQTLKAYFAANPDAFFDVINVDGDHTIPGAAEDLIDVLPRLKVGGVILFDDVSNPNDPGLNEVWKRIVADDVRFSAATFDSVGYGVGLAVRRI